MMKILVRSVVAEDEIVGKVWKFAGGKVSKTE